MSVCQVCTFTLVTLAPGQGVQGFWSPGTISLPWGNFLSCLSGTLTKVSIGIETTPSVSHNSVSELQQRSLKVLEKRSLMRLLYNDDANGWYLLTKLLPSSYISTFCVVIVCFTDMISKYTLFQAFYSLLIFFGMFLWAFHFPEKYAIWVQCFFPHFTMK